MPLELTDLPLDGLQVEQRGVFEAGANVGSGTTDIFLFPPRGTRGALLSGDRTLDNTEITRVRITNGGNRLTINDSDQPNALNLEDYFESGGDGRDLTIYFVTKLGMFSIPIADANDNDNYANIGGSFIRFDLSNNNIDQGDGFGFDNAGVGFDQARFLPAAYSAQDILRSIDNGDRFILAFARPARRAVEADVTFPAFTATATVQTRTPDRHEITAAKTFPAFTVAHDVLQRTAARIEITASKVFPAFSSDHDVLMQAPGKVLLSSDVTHPAFSVTATVQTRDVNRHELEANQVFPAVASTTQVLQRTAQRNELEASATYPAFTATVDILIRGTSRHNVEASQTFPAFTATATLQTRMPVRKELQANQVFPALTATVNVLSETPLAGSVVFPAFASTAAVQTRMPVRKELQSTPTFPALTTSLTLTKGEPRLTIADFTPHAGYTIDALAVWTRSSTTNGILWNAAGSRFSGTDVLNGGELGISTSNAPLIRIRNPSNNRIQFNEDSPLNITDYFTTGEGSDALLTFQTIDGVESFTSAALDNSGGGFAWFDTSDALDTLLANVLVGDSIIFAIELAIPRSELETAGGINFPQFTATLSLQSREADRHLLTAGQTFPALSAAIAVGARQPLPITKTYPAFTSTATVLKRAPASRELQASLTFPAMATALDLYETERIEAAQTFPAMATALDVLNRTPTRHVVQGAPTFPAFTATLTLGKRIALTGAVTFPAMSATTDVLTSMVTRHEVQAAPVFPAMVATATVFQTERVEASATFPAFTATATLQKRATARIPLTAGTVFPSMSSTATVAAQIPVTVAATFPAFSFQLNLQTRDARRKDLEAAGIFPAMASTAAVGKRIPLPADKTFRVWSAAVDVRQRTPVREAIIPRLIFPAFTATATVGKRKPLAVNVTYNAMTVAVAVQQRMANRQELQASATFPAFTATAVMGQRSPLEATRTFPAISADLRVDQRTPARLVAEASLSFPAFSAAVDMGKRIPLPLAPVFPAFSSTAAVSQRSAVRHDLQVTSNFPAFSASVALGSRQPLDLAQTFPAFAATATVDQRSPVRHALQGAATFPPVSAALSLSQRESAQKALEVNVTYNAMTATVAVQSRRIDEELIAAATFPAMSVALDVSKRIAGPPIQLVATRSFAAATFGPVELFQREANEINLTGGINLPPFTATLNLSKGEAMPPDQVMGVVFVESGYTTITITWVQPAFGTGIFLHYEYRIDSNPWISTMSADTRHVIPDLMPGTEYRIAVRAVSNIGRGAPSMPIFGRTQPVTVPQGVGRLTATPPGGGIADLAWETPSDNGGDPITHYEAQVIDPDNDHFPVESTGGTALRHRVRGLQAYQRYGFQVRAVNDIGPSAWSNIVYATPLIATTAATVAGQRVPLLDLDRQSLILRLAGRDCRLTVWWQPSDAAWYATMEVPVNTTVVSGRRLVVNAGLLDRLPGILPGNIILRAIDEDSAARDPARDSWQRQSHGLIYET